MLLLQCRRTILHFLLEFHGPRQSPSLVPRCPHFLRDTYLAYYHGHRERSNFTPLHAQSIGLYRTAQFLTDKNLPGALRKWRAERMSLAGSAVDPIDPFPASGTRIACEHIVVFSKRDLVPEWGIEVRASRVLGYLIYLPKLSIAPLPQPFRKAMAAKFPDQSSFFASWHRPRDIRSLSDLLISQFHSLPSRNHASCV